MKPLRYRGGGITQLPGGRSRCVHNSPETTSGGKALKFYASVRLDVRRIETLKEGTDAVGNRTRVKVVKNKMSPPFKVAEFDIIYGVGISREGSLIDLGVDQGIVRKSGAWYTYEGDQLGQGKENARNFLRENPDLANEIEKRIKEKLGVGPRIDADATATATASNGNCRQRQRWQRHRRQRQQHQRAPGRQRCRAVPDRRYCPGCHGLAHDPQRPGFRVRGRGVRGHGPRHSRP